MKKSKKLSGSPVFEISLIQAIENLEGRNAVNFSIENLRVCIGQKHRLHELMPVALAALQDNPLAQGDLYPGDLLNSVLTVADTYWRDNLRQKAEVLEIVKRVGFGDEYQADTLVKAMQSWLSA